MNREMRHGQRQQDTKSPPRLTNSGFRLNMAVKKLSNDVLSHLDKIIEDGSVPNFRGWIELKRDRTEYVKFRENKGFWINSDVAPSVAPVGLFANDSSYEPEHYQHYRLYFYRNLKEVFIFQNSAYVVTGHFSEEEKSLLVQAEHDKERSKFERLKRKFELAQNLEEKPKRRPIPEEVRVAVWRRDQGTCVKCRSRERLEYDHIIPVAEGGGDSVRNIELLCEKCNRSKGARIQ